MRREGNEPPVLRRPALALVLDRLIASGTTAVTGTELMAATALSRASVHSLSEVLIELGLVVEVDGQRPVGPGRAGRTARAYQFNASMGYVIGVDLGDHKVSVGISDLAGNEVSSRTEPFASLSLSGHDRITVTRRLIRSVLRSAGLAATSVLCCAIGVAAPVGRTGRIIGSDEPGYLPGLAGMDIAKGIGRGYLWPVLLDNDANLAALAERWRGAGVGVDDLVVLLSGERLGAGLISGGQLQRGFHQVAGELAFLDLVTGVEDTTGVAGLAETLGRQALARVQPIPESTGLSALKAKGDPTLVHSDQVVDAARHGDPVAADILHQIAERMARVVAVLATLLDPELVIFAGGGAAAIDLIRDDISRRLPAFVPQPPRIVASSLGEGVVLAGATKLALDHAHHTLYRLLD